MIPDTNAAKDFLRSTNLLKHRINDRNFWDNILSLNIQSHEKGEDIVNHGQVGGSLYIIYSGAVDILIGPQVFTTLLPGAFFGELEISYSEKSLTYQGTARASDQLKSGEAVGIIELLPHTVRSLIIEDNQFKINLLSVIQQRVRALHWFVRMSRVPDVLNQVACALMYIFEGFHSVFLLDDQKNQITPGHKINDFTLSHKEFKKLTGGRSVNSIWSALGILMSEYHTIYFNFVDPHKYGVDNSDRFNKNLHKINAAYKKTVNALRCREVFNFIQDFDVDMYNYDKFINMCNKIGFDFHNPPVLTLKSRPFYSFKLIDESKLIQIASSDPKPS